MKHTIKVTMNYRYIIILLPLLSVWIQSSQAGENHRQRHSKQNHLWTSEARFTIKNWDVKSRLLEHYAHWKGTRYQFGGITSLGIDCSAFVQTLFKEKFRKKLPRTTLEQRKLGQMITKKQLAPGDLIFFTMSENERHVGVYLGNGQFMHASSSQGVTISHLNTPYWEQRYNQSRRIITEQKKDWRLG